MNDDQPAILEAGGRAIKSSVLRTMPFVCENTAMKYSIWIERILGLLFVVAAALKALDLADFAVQIAYYHVFEEPLLWKISAVGAIFAETALGMALLVGLRLRGLTLAATFA
ncbi:MAG: hypothetical protein JXR94_06605, partial [Candidatus Hydrogenedentes bacterium]|nr:hypothetical protein [Candidatus Hydrogenedentota bacterium]